MTKKTTKKSKGLTPSMVVKSEKSTDYIYKLKNGSEIAFKDDKFPFVDHIPTQGQLQLF